MHCSTLKRLSLLGLAIVVAACSDQSTPGPTGLAPSQRPSLAASAGACSSQLANQVSSEQRDLFSGSTANDAKTLFRAIQANCPNTSELMLSYVQFTIDQYRLGNIKTQTAGTKEQAVVSHWNSLFAYVGLPVPNAPSAVLLPDGAAGVITQAGGVRDLTAPPGPQGLGAGLHVPDNAAVGSHLYTITLISPNCLITTLGQTGNCYELNSYPHVVTFNPRVTVVVCQAGHLDSHLALGHVKSNGETEVLPRPSGAQFPALCGEPVGALPFEKAGIVGRALATAVNFFRPRPLYAAHGGLGGLSEAMSPFGGVELTFFRSTFTGDALNAPPGAPEKGAWTSIVADAPGSITVQSALADMATKPVVLNQAGGNCTVCGGLELRGEATTASEVDAATGVFIARWDAVQDKPTPKNAPIVLRSSAGLEIARVSHVRTSSARILTYNGVTLPVSWNQSVTQSFMVVVDLAAKTTSLTIDGVPVAGFQNVPFVNAAAADVRRIAAEFTGIDSGVFGWDNVSIVKVAPAP